MTAKGIPTTTFNGPIDRLQLELAHLGGVCAATLLGASGKVDADEGPAKELASLLQSPLFRKGLAIHSSIQADFARTGVLDILASDSPQERFLQDFIASTTDTAGGRFASWIQGDSVVEPSATRVRRITSLSKEDGSKESPFSIKRGTTHNFDVVTCDSVGKPIHHANTKVAVAVVYQNSEPILPEPEQSPFLEDLLTSTPAKIDDKGNTYHSSFHSHNFSPEEARLQYVSTARSTFESTVEVDMVAESEYTVAWTPMRTGDVQLTVLVEDISVAGSLVYFKVEQDEVFGVAAEATEKMEEVVEKDDAHGDGITMTPSAMCYKAVQDTKIVAGPTAEAFSVSPARLALGKVAHVAV